MNIPSIFNIRLEFILFALILIGVAFFHKKVFWVALFGLLSIFIFKLIFEPQFNFAHHIFGEVPFIKQIIHKDLRQGEWGILLNLFGLLLGFTILAKHFEQSRVPDVLLKFLPNDWKGPFVLLALVFILATFLDNIAAAVIGGTVASVVFKKRLHIGFIVAIAAVSNAGGAGSVLGSTPTTMMWIEGVSALNVLHAFIPAIITLLIIGWFASHQQDKYQQIQKNVLPDIKIDWGRVLIVILILAGAITSNILYDMPALGVWTAILIGACLKKTHFGEIKHSLKGTFFLIFLVTSASLMPVEELPPPSPKSSFIYGLISAVFDNIPLTKLCLQQGCYDWGMLSFTVNFGGSITWFGSSAGVAVTNEFPEARNVVLWIRKSWYYIVLSYIIGFFVLYSIFGWEPADTRNIKVKDCIEVTTKY